MSDTDPKHVLTIKIDEHDEWPVASALRCEWGDDPERPCRSWICEECYEYADAGCIEAGHEGAHEAEGCGIKSWFDETGLEGITVRGVEIEVRTEARWNGKEECWELTAVEAPHA